LYIADYNVDTDDEGDNIYTGRVLNETTSGATEAITPESGGQGLLSPRGIAVDATGNVYVANAVAGKIIKISSGGVITNAAGDLRDSTDCPAVYFNINSTQLACPAGVAVDNSGNLSPTPHTAASPGSLRKETSPTWLEIGTLETTEVMEATLVERLSISR
jgi:hypothetical protein